MLTRSLSFLLLFLATAAFAQPTNCVFKEPFYRIHFGTGNVQDVNTASLSLYTRVSFPCPGDGYYAYTSYTSDCFRGDWHTLTEDHTPGDVGGNMLIVNSAYEEGVFLTTRVRGFKGGKTYQFGAWLMNVCKPSRKCPFPLLPNLLIRLQTPSGKTVGQFVTGELPRIDVPKWSEHKAQFTVPASETELQLTMIDNAPGGCGNDFALDDITFRECVMPDPARMVEEKKTRLVPVKKQPAPIAKVEVKKSIPLPQQISKGSSLVTIVKTTKEIPLADKPLPAPKMPAILPVPTVLKQRANALAKQIEANEGEIVIDLYDNGEIDGDTVSIYHNNALIVDRQQLAKKPITFRIRVDKVQPHHELVMVANNLGSIPPNTSLMMVTAKEKRYQVFISSTEQQNAKVVIDLKE